HSTGTSLQCSPGSVQVSTSSTCTVTVTDTSATPTTPTGTVGFTTNSTGTFNPTPASCTLVAGTAGSATCQVSYTPGATAIGHHLITGNYAGDSTHLTSSGSFNLAATSAPPPPPHPTSTTIQCSPAPVQVSIPTSCAATVTDTSATGATTPSGSVSFTTNSTGTFNPTSASCTLAAGTIAGTATCSVSYSPGASAVGHHLITGAYGSDSTHASSSGAFNLLVTAAPPPPPHPTSTAIQCSPSPVQVSSPTSCTATVADTSLTGVTGPTGSVSFTTNSTGTFSPTSAICTLSPGTIAGTATCSLSYTPTVGGHHLITGSYPGDSTHATSSGTFTLELTSTPPPPPHPTTTTVSCSPSSVQLNVATTCAAMVTDTSTTGATTPTGTVMFTTNSTGTFTPAPTCTLAGTTTGTASCSISYTPTVNGHHLITGSYSSDSTHLASTGSFNVAVSSAVPPPLHTTKIVVTCSPGSASVNTSASCTARVIDNSTSPTVPAGTVTFTTNSTGTFNPSSATCTLVAGNAPNQATCSIAYTPTVAGKHVITGSYVGDSSHAKSSGGFTLNVRSPHRGSA